MKGWVRQALWAVGLLVAGCWPALSQGQAEGLGPVVVLEQSELPGVLVDSVAWLPDNRHLAVGGWLEWPQAPVVTLLPNDLPVMQAATQAASPRFALSPEGRRLAFWKKIQVGLQTKAELNIINLQTGTGQAAGLAVEVNEALQLVWLPGEMLVYATEDAVRGTANLQLWSLNEGQSRAIVELRDVSWRQLTPGTGAGEVWAQVAGGAVYRVDVASGEFQRQPAAARLTPSPAGQGRSFEIDGEGNLIITLSASEGVIVSRGVRAAQWRADGRAILYVTDHEVCLCNPDGSEPRVLVSLTELAAQVYLRGCQWSADGEQIAYWAVGGGSGRSWRAVLGLEQITARFQLGASAPAQAGDRLWVVGAYQRDREGAIIEPVWNTLKACFEITRLLRTPEGLVVEAKNIGTQGGVVERVAGEALDTSDDAGHISIGIAGGPVATWNRTSVFKFRPGLSGWLEKTPYVGEALSLQVERQTLPNLSLPRPHPHDLTGL